MKNLGFVFLAAFFGFSVLSARAMDRMDADFAAAGSIAVPGSSTAVFTNPAGLVSSKGARLSLQAGSDDPWKNPYYRPLLVAGNGTFGVAAGVDYQMIDRGQDKASAVYGLGINLDALGLSVGIAGRTGMKTDEGTDFNLGLLLRPTQYVTIGGTAKGMKDGADSYGVGVAFELLSGVDLVADSAFDSKMKNGEIKPGLKLSNPYAGIAVSYGTGDTAQFSKDFGASAYLRVGSNSELELQYNHGGSIPKYYGALSLGF